MLILTIAAALVLALMGLAVFVTDRRLKWHHWPQ
jgi:hypothetical protein